MIREEDKCSYCDTEFVVEFEYEDNELLFCPFCGEELMEFEEENEWLDEDEDWD